MPNLTKIKIYMEQTKITRWCRKDVAVVRGVYVVVYEVSVHSQFLSNYRFGVMLQ